MLLTLIISLIVYISLLMLKKITKIKFFFTAAYLRT